MSSSFTEPSYDEAPDEYPGLTAKSARRCIAFLLALEVSVDVLLIDDEISSSTSASAYSLVELDPAASSAVVTEQRG
jgi:hypothetical protein